MRWDTDNAKYFRMDSNMECEVLSSQCTSNIDHSSHQIEYESKAETRGLNMSVDKVTNSSKLHPSESDVKDGEAIAALYGDEADECCHEVRCNRRIPKEFAIKHRYAFMELTKKEQDLVILSQLQAFCTVPELATEYGDFTKRGSSRMRGDKKLRNASSYHFCGLPVCVKMYFFLHDIGRTRYANLKKHFETFGIVTRVHKLTNIKPSHKKALSAEDTIEIVNFIKGFGDCLGLPVSRRLPACKKMNIIKLPSNESKTSLHRKYLEATKDRPHLQRVARSTFSQIWTKYCPEVVINRSAQELVKK